MTANNITGRVALFMPTFQLGGGEKTFVILANNFVRSGYLVDFVVSKKEGVFLKQVSEKVRIIETKRRVRSILPSLIWYLLRVKSDYFLSGSDFPNYLSLIAGWITRSKTRIIVAQHRFYDIESRHLGLYDRLSPWLMRKLYPKAYKVIAVSEAIRSFLISSGIAPEKIETIYNLIDIQELIVKSQELPGIEIKSPYIVFVGRLSVVKNLPFLLDAYQQLPNRNDLKFVIVGDGEERSALENWIEQKGLQSDVLLIGQTDNPYPYIKQSELLVLGSLSESFSLVIAESILLGKTVVSTPTGGAMELLEQGKYGYLSADFHDSKAFSGLIEKALEHPVPAALLSERTAVFNPEKIIEKFKAIMP
jgi:glycosyltransferase involved in cell wall biosynthesis